MLKYPNKIIWILFLLLDSLVITDKKNRVIILSEQVLIDLQPLSRIEILRHNNFADALCFINSRFQKYV